MLNFFFFSIIIFLLLPCSCWRNLCLLVVVEDMLLKASYELVRAFYHLHYSTFYISTIVPDIQNRPSCSPFGGVEKRYVFLQ
ncbi:hypothetical protein HOY80DRAFT_991823 [Tuber brumale]|nr:hypothetical protein HOY80DRAFT_991823 [Tuber brumale]